MKRRSGLGCILWVMAIFINSCAPNVYRNTTAAPATNPAQEPASTTPPVPPPPAKDVLAPAPSKKPTNYGAMNTLSAAEKAQGWQLLFDGTSTDGWHAYGSRTIGTAWKVSNGVLYIDNNKDGESKSGGDIVSDEEYANFELQLDWKIDVAGNSGICIYVKEDKNKYDWMWNTGPEIQIVDNDGHPDGKIDKHMAGDLYDLVPSKSKAQKRPLEWNHYLIRCVSGNLDVYLNDVHILSTTLWNDDWRSLVAGSKFKNMADFGTYKSGRIGLQDHGDKVWFRNIKIRKL